MYCGMWRAWLRKLGMDWMLSPNETSANSPPEKPEKPSTEVATTARAIEWTPGEIDWVFCYRHAHHAYPWDIKFWDTLSIQDLYKERYLQRAMDEDYVLLGAWCGSPKKVKRTAYFDYGHIVPNAWNAWDVIDELTHLNYDTIIPYDPHFLIQNKIGRQTHFGMGYGITGLTYPYAEYVIKKGEDYRYIVLGQPTPFGDFYLVFDDIKRDEHNNPHPMQGIYHTQSAETLREVTI